MDPDQLAPTDNKSDQIINCFFKKKYISEFKMDMDKQTALMRLFFYFSGACLTLIPPIFYFLKNQSLNYRGILVTQEMEIFIFPDNYDIYGFLNTFSRYEYLLSQIM